MPNYSRESDVEQLVKKAMAASNAFRDELRRQLKRRLGKDMSIPELIRAAARTLGSMAPELGRLLADASVASVVSGAGAVASRVSESAATTGFGGTVPPFPPRPTIVSGWEGDRVWLPIIRGASEDLQARQLMTRDEFDRLDAFARQRAFTVAGLKSEEALETVRKALVDATDKGQDFRTFRKAMLDAADTSELGIGHLENIFRTNIQSGYSRGMDRVLANPVVAGVFVYEEVRPIFDSRLTELCYVISKSGIQGTGIYRLDDPVYQKFKSPRHWRDRCGRRPLTIREAARRGIQEAQRWLDTGEPPLVPAHVPHPPVELPKGWVSSEAIAMSMGVAA